VIGMVHVGMCVLARGEWDYRDAGDIGVEDGGWDRGSW
jgi:hypothetical protein